MRRAFGWANCLRVNVKRRSQRRMPHRLLHHLELDSEAPEQSAVGMAERVPPDALLNTQLFRWQQPGVMQ